jgi:hypothetical protein
VLFPSIPFISLAAGENVKTLEQLGTATITPGQLGTPWLNVEGVGKKKPEMICLKKGILQKLSALRSFRTYPILNCRDPPVIMAIEHAKKNTTRFSWEDQPSMVRYIYHKPLLSHL